MQGGKDSASCKGSLGPPDPKVTGALGGKRRGANAEVQATAKQARAASASAAASAARKVKKEQSNEAAGGGGGAGEPAASAALAAGGGAGGLASGGAAPAALQPRRAPRASRDSSTFLPSSVPGGVDVDSGAAAPAPAARAPTDLAAAKAAALAGIAARAGAAREAREARAASGRAALRPAVALLLSPTIHNTIQHLPSYKGQQRPSSPANPSTILHNSRSAPPPISSERLLG